MASALKQPKEAVGYEDPAKGKDHCRDCRFFVVPNACRKVEGRILGTAWCRLFRAKRAIDRSGMRG